MKKDSNFSTWILQLIEVKRTLMAFCVQKLWRLGVLFLYNGKCYEESGFALFAWISGEKIYFYKAFKKELHVTPQNVIHAVSLSEL